MGLHSMHTERDGNRICRSQMIELGQAVTHAAKDIEIEATRRYKEQQGSSTICIRQWLIHHRDIRISTRRAENCLSIWRMMIASSCECNKYSIMFRQHLNNRVTVFPIDSHLRGNTVYDWQLLLHDDDKNAVENMRRRSGAILRALHKLSFCWLKFWI